MSSTCTGEKDVHVRLGPADRLLADAMVRALGARGVAACRVDAAVSSAGAGVLVADVHDTGSVADARRSGVPLLLLAPRDDAFFRRAARAAGATGLVGRCTDLDTFVASVRAALAGDEPTVGGTRAEHPPGPVLTSRELDVLQLMAEGHDNATIAHQLEISPHTARTHVQRILTKFEVRSRFGAVSVARGHGLLRTGT